MKITNRPYLFFNLSRDHSPDTAKNPRYRYSAITALANVAVLLFHNLSILPPISLHLTDYRPPTPRVVPCYRRLKRCATHHLLADWATAPVPVVYPYPARSAITTSGVSGSSSQEAFIRYTLEKFTWQHTIDGTTWNPKRSAHSALKPNSPSSTPCSHAPRPHLRDHTSSIGSQIKALRPPSVLTRRCSLTLLCSFTPPLRASGLECHNFCLHFTLPPHDSLLSSSLPPAPRPRD